MVEIRLATDSDWIRVRRLAELDSAGAPSGELLLAEEDGVLRAALDPCTGAVIADPFVASEHLVAALRAYAAPRRPRRRPLGAQPLTRSILGS